MNRSKGDWVVQRRTPELPEGARRILSERGFSDRQLMPGWKGLQPSEVLRNRTFEEACDYLMTLRPFSTWKLRVVRRSVGAP